MQYVVGLLSVALLAGCYQDRNESIKLMNQGRDLYKGGNPTAAVNSLKEAYSVDPTNHRAMYFEGMILVQGIAKSTEATTEQSKKDRLSVLRQAEESLRAAIKLKDDEADYHYQLGRALVFQEKHEMAITAFSRVVDLDPGHGESLHRWGKSLEALKKNNEAQDKYREALTKDPSLCYAFHDLGQLYVRYEEFNHAAKVFRNGTKNCPEFAANFGSLGFVYARMEYWDDAVKALEKATKMPSRTPNPAYFLSLALSYRALGDNAKAIRSFKAFVMNSRGAAKKDPSVNMKIEYAEGLISQLESQ